MQAKISSSGNLCGSKCHEPRDSIKRQRVLWLMVIGGELRTHLNFKTKGELAVQEVNSLGIGLFGADDCFGMCTDVNQDFGISHEAEKVSKS